MAFDGSRVQGSLTLRLLGNGESVSKPVPAVFRKYLLGHEHNSHRARAPVLNKLLSARLPARELGRARREIEAWNGYAPTRLVALSGLARTIRIEQLWLKDESQRFGIGSFKALGGGYAVFRLLADRLEATRGQRIADATALCSPEHAPAIADLTVTCATDGNHGRAVAWAAAKFGCRCVIYIHSDVSAGREAALRCLGADVVRVAGNYDDSVRRAAAEAARQDWILVADTAANASDRSPRYVMAGYTVLMAEIAAQLRDVAPPTHVFIQAGVGGLAAAVVAGLHQYWAESKPRLVVVEPETANCVFASVQVGNRVTVIGSLDTLMAGLACGEVSFWAWPILNAAVDDMLTLPEALVQPTMRLLFRGTDGDPRVVSGESGCAGLSAVIAARQQELTSHALELTSRSRVLVINTEGATDPAIFETLVPEAYA